MEERQVVPHTALMPNLAGVGERWANWLKERSGHRKNGTVAGGHRVELYK